MEVIVIDSEAYEKLKLDLEILIKKAVLDVLIENKLKENSEWLTLREAQEILPFRSKTSWQKLRDTGTILFTQPEKGRKIMYSRKSISEYLNKNKIG